MTVKSVILTTCPPFLRKHLTRIEESPIEYRLAKGMFWSMAGAVISRGLMLVASIFVARILGREVYGEFGIIRSTVNMFLVFAAFGLGLTATKYVAEFRKTDPARAGRIMALSGLFAVATGSMVMLGLLAFAPWLAAHTINAPHLSGELRIGAIILLINALNSTQTGALAGFEAFKTIARVNIGVGLASFPLLVSGAYFGGLRGAVWALATNMAINWLLNYLALRSEAIRHHTPFALKGCIKEWRILWSFSLPAAMSSVMAISVLWLCNAILVNQPDGYGQMGLFDAANQWRIAILFIPGMVCQIALPMLSSLNGLNDQAKYMRVLKYNAMLNGGAALVVALPIALASLWIMEGYGPGFGQGKWVLVVLAVSTIFAALNTVIGQAIASKGRMWIGLSFNALWAIALLASGLILIRQGYGAIGLALANLIAYLLHSLWQSGYVFWVLKPIE